MGGACRGKCAVQHGAWKRGYPSPSFSKKSKSFHDMLAPKCLMVALTASFLCVPPSLGALIASLCCAELLYLLFLSFSNSKLSNLMRRFARQVVCSAGCGTEQRHGTVWTVPWRLPWVSFLPQQQSVCTSRSQPVQHRKHSEHGDTVRACSFPSVCTHTHKPS